MLIINPLTRSLPGYNSRRKSMTMNNNLKINVDSWKELTEEQINQLTQDELIEILENCDWVDFLNEWSDYKSGSLPSERCCGESGMVTSEYITTREDENIHDLAKQQIEKISDYKNFQSKFFSKILRQFAKIKPDKWETYNYGNLISILKDKKYNIQKCMKPHPHRTRWEEEHTDNEEYERYCDDYNEVTTYNMPYHYKIGYIDDFINVFKKLEKLSEEYKKLQENNTEYWTIEVDGHDFTLEPASAVDYWAWQLWLYDPIGDDWQYGKDWREAHSDDKILTAIVDKLDLVYRES